MVQRLKLGLQVGEKDSCWESEFGVAGGKLKALVYNSLEYGRQVIFK